MTTITYELHAVNMDGRPETRAYNTLEEAKMWQKAYGNGKIFKVVREEVEE